MRAWEGLKVCQNVVWVSSGCAMGLELGLGTFAQKALCTVPSSPGSHSGPKNLAKKNSETMVHCRLGIPERRVTGVDARARVRGGRAATTRSRVFLLMHTWVAARCFSSSSPPRTTAAVLGAAEPTALLAPERGARFGGGRHSSFGSCVDHDLTGRLDPPQCPSRLHKTKKRTSLSVIAA